MGTVIPIRGHSFTINQGHFSQMEPAEVNRFVGSIRRFIDDHTLSVGLGSCITRDEITVVSDMGLENERAFLALDAFTTAYLIALGFDEDGTRTRV